MKDYIYIGIIAALFLVFFMLHIIQSSRISKLMKKYEAFMEGKPCRCHWRKLPANGKVRKQLPGCRSQNGQGIKWNHINIS